MGRECERISMVLYWGDDRPMALMDRLSKKQALRPLHEPPRGIDEGGGVLCCFMSSRIVLPRIIRILF